MVAFQLSSARLKWKSIYQCIYRRFVHGWVRVRLRLYRANNFDPISAFGKRKRLGVYGLCYTTLLVILLLKAYDLTNRHGDFLSLGVTFCWCQSLKPLFLGEFTVNRYFSRKTSFFWFLNMFRQSQLWLVDGLTDWFPPGIWFIIPTTITSRKK